MGMNPELEKHVEAVYMILTTYAQDARAAKAVQIERARLEGLAQRGGQTPQQMVELRARTLKLTTFMHAVHSYAEWRRELAKRKKSRKLQVVPGAATPPENHGDDYECDECGLQGFELPHGGQHAEDCPNRPKGA